MTTLPLRHKLLIGLFIGGVLAVAMSLINTPVSNGLDAALIAHVTGLAAGYLVAVLLLLMSRTPMLEHRVGPDTVARWHARCGRIFLVLVLVHGAAAVQSWAASRGEDPLIALVAVLQLPGLIAATIGTAMFIAIAAISIRVARRKLSYERWHGVHLLTYVAVGLSFAHELAGPNLAGVWPIQVLWSLMYAWVFALILRYRVIAPLGVLWRHRLRVEAVIPEAFGVVSIVMSGHHLEELGGESGQFFRWRFLNSHLWRSAHPFSLSAPPRGNRMRITVKALGTGSSRVQAVKPGTLVFAEGPSGSMTAHRRQRSSVVLIAGGVGITPMRALFETIEVPGPLILLYRVSSPRDIVFQDELEAIARRRGARIIWMVGPSSQPGNQMTPQNLYRLIPEVAQSDVYLCASPPLARAVRTTLQQLGLPARQLHEEVFAF